MGLVSFYHRSRCWIILLKSLNQVYTMRTILLNTLLLCVYLYTVAESAKVVCYYNSAAFWRKGVARVTSSKLEPALHHCNYLIYGYVGINTATYAAESLDHELDAETGKNYFKVITGLKNQFPNLKVLLSVGGYADYSITEKYLRLLENMQNRQNFICSFKQMAKEYGFDGVDLAWQFPPTKESKETTPSGVIWDTMKKYTSFFVTDNTPAEHRDQFVQLCQEMKASLQMDNLILTLSILPNANYKVYYDKEKINEYVDQIHLMTHDYRIPERLPSVADYSSPLSYVAIADRNPEQNIEATVNWWLNSTIPANKLLLSVTTYGRTWKLSALSGHNSVPPLHAIGPGEKGPFLSNEGVWAYYEICSKLTDQTLPDSLKIVLDPITYQGNYAFRLPANIFSHGIWISYEDPKTAAHKAEYAVEKGLGGVAIVDLSLDDSRGSCSLDQTKFPILTAVKNVLPLETVTKIVAEPESPSTKATVELPETTSPKTTSYPSTSLPEEISTQSFSTSLPEEISTQSFNFTTFTTEALTTNIPDILPVNHTKLHDEDNIDEVELTTSKLDDQPSESTVLKEKILPLSIPIQLNRWMEVFPNNHTVILHTVLNMSLFGINTKHFGSVLHVSSNWTNSAQKYT